MTDYAKQSRDIVDRAGEYPYRQISAHPKLASDIAAALEATDKARAEKQREAFAEIERITWRECWDTTDMQTAINDIRKIAEVAAILKEPV